MNLPPAEWDRPIIPTDSVTYVPVTIDTEASIARAYELWPEIRENRLAIDSVRIGYLFARNQVLPQVDAILGYYVAVAAGRTDNLATGQPVAGVAPPTYGTGLRLLFRHDFHGWH